MSKLHGALLSALIVFVSGCEAREAELDLRRSELLVPLQPRDEGSLPTWALAERVDGPRLILRTTIDLAFGEGYPTTFRATLPSPLWSDCGQLVGAVQLDGLSGGTPAIEAQLASGRIELSVTQAGTTELELAARIVLDQPNGCELPVGVEIPIDVHVSVRVFRPSGTTFDLPFDCTKDALLVAPSTGLTGQGVFASRSAFRVVLLDEAGERAHAANASPEAQATVRLVGNFSAAEPEPRTLADWIAPAWPGPVKIVPELGAPLHIEVIGGDAITRVDLAFHLIGAKSPMRLENGQSYGEGGWGATYNRIEATVSALYAGETGLCSSPSPSWLELASETKRNCEVETVSREDSGDEHGLLDRSARLLADGTCKLRVDAPELPLAAGLPASLSASFRNVGDLWD